MRNEDTVKVEFDENKKGRLSPPANPLVKKSDDTTQSSENKPQFAQNTGTTSHLSKRARRKLHKRKALEEAGKLEVAAKVKKESEKQQNKKKRHLKGKVPNFKPQNTNVLRNEREATPNYQDFYNLRADTLTMTKDELSEYDIVGMNISNKLAKMDPVQAVYAESIINNVFCKGLLRQLTENTDLCDNNCCNRRTVIQNFTNPIYSNWENYNCCNKE